MNEKLMNHFQHIYPLKLNIKKKNEMSCRRRSDKLQCGSTAASSEVYRECDLNLVEHKMYRNKSRSTSLHQSSQPWFHLCGLITAGFQN